MSSLFLVLLLPNPSKAHNIRTKDYKSLALLLYQTNLISNKAHKMNREIEFVKSVKK